jgi:transcriptional regulator with XRE-family HTH domain
MPQNKLAELRRALDKSLIDIYHETSVPVYATKAIESGKAKPEPHELELLAQAYGVTEDELREIVGMKEGKNE